MKLKRILALAVSLAMVLSIVPAFSLTAGAAEPTYNSDQLIGWASADGYSFIGDTDFPSGDSKSGEWVSTGDYYFDTTQTSNVSGTNWEGWTSNDTKLRMYKIKRLLLAPDAHDGGETPYVLTASNAVQNGTKDKDFMVIEFSPMNKDWGWTASNDAYFDVAYADSTGEIFDTFRIARGTDGIGYDYGSNGWANSKTNVFTGKAQGYSWEASSSGVKGSEAELALYRMTYQNDKDGDGYTVSYYYNEGGDTTFNWIGTKTFSTGTFNGFQSMQFGYVRGNQRIEYFKVYAGNYPTETVAYDFISSITGIPEMTRDDFTLPVTLTNEANETASVSWTSDSSAVTISGANAAVSTQSATKATLTATITYAGTSSTTTAVQAYTVNVFPKKYTAGDAVTDDFKAYSVTNVTEFDHVWTKRQDTDAASPRTDVTTSEVNTVKYSTLPGLGGVSDGARGTMAITPGKTYLLRFYYGGTALDQATENKYNKVYATATQFNDEHNLNYISGAVNKSITTTANEWTEVKSVFTAPEGANYAAFVYSWQTAGLIVADVELCELEAATETTTLTVKYTDEAGTVLKSETVAAASVGASYTPTVPTEYLLIDNALYKVGTIEGVTNISAANNTATVNLAKLYTAGSNLVTNGDFQTDIDFTGGIDGWTTLAGAAIENGYDASTKTSYGFLPVEVVKDQYALKARDTNNEEDRNTLQNKTTVEENSIYYVTIDGIACLDRDNGQYAWFNVYSDATATRQLGNTTRWMINTDGFKTTEYIAETAAGENAIAFEGSWFANAVPIIDNLGIYKLTKIPATVTVNYVADGKTIKTVTDATHFAGDTFTTELPGTITFDGTTYVPNEAIETVTVSAENTKNVIEVSYKQGVIAATEITATTRAGIVPTLPDKIDANLEGGATANVNVSWTYPAASEFTVAKSPVTVYGEVTGSNAEIKATVTVEDKDNYLVAHYKFDENGTNSAKEGTYTATAGSNTSYVDGIYGKAVYLPGGSSGTGAEQADNVVTLAGDLIADDKITQSGEITITAFVKHENENSDWWARLFDFGNAGSGTDFFYAIPAARTLVQSNGEVTHTNALPQNEWAHIAISVSGTKASIYVNGVLDGSGEFLSSFTAVGGIGANYYIGASNWSDPLLKGAIDDFKVYSIALTDSEVADMYAAMPKAVTVNYVGKTAEGTELFTDSAVGYAGNTITLTPPDSYTASDGTLYARDASVSTTVSVTEGMAAVEFTYSQDKIASVEDPTDTTTFILGNTPVLPKTLPAKTVSGVDTTAAVTWITDNITTDTPTIYGTVANAAEGVQAKAPVKVLAKTFSMDNMTSKLDGSSDKNRSNDHILPVAVTGASVFEFDLKFNRLTNEQVIILANSTAIASKLYGGPAQIQLGCNSGGTFNATNQGGTNPTATVTAGSTYRVMITTTPSASNATYDIKMTASDGTVIMNSTGNNYRTSADSLDRFIFVTNGGGGADGDMEVTNFKVNAPDVASAVGDYTITYQGIPAGTKDINGNALDTTFVAIQDTIDKMPTNPYLAGFTPPEIDGYVLVDYSLDTSAKTYTLVYEPHEDNIGTWFMRNDITSGDMLIADMNMLGAHDAFTAKMTKTVDAAMCLSGDEGARALHGMGLGVNWAQTQDATPAQLLRAGVRYFDVRLSISDATENSVPYRKLLTSGTNDNVKGTNGEFYTTHSYLCQPFITVLWEIRDICRENPGEVIILDFQEIYDSYNNASGTSDATYAQLAKVIKSVLGDYLVPGTESAATLTWNKATNSGKKAGVICIGKPGSQNANAAPDTFILGGDRNGTKEVSTDNAGSETKSSIYSYYESDNESVADMANTIAGDQMTYSATPNTRFKVMQAIYGKVDFATILKQVAGNESAVDLIGNGTEVAKQLKTVDPSKYDTFYSDWMKTLKIVMVNNADDYYGAYDYITDMSAYNRDTYDRNYKQSSNGVTMTTPAGAGDNVPLSTAFLAAPTDKTETITVGGTAYTAVKSYALSLTRYESVDMDVTGTVSLAFDSISPSKHYDNVLLFKADGATDYTVVDQALYGTAVTAENLTTIKGEYVLATVDNPDVVDITLVYTDGTNTIANGWTDAYYSTETIVDFSAHNSFYLETLDGNKYIVNGGSKAYTPADDTDGDGTIELVVTVEQKYAVLTDALWTNNGKQVYGGLDGNHLMASVNGTADDLVRAKEYDADNVRLIQTTDKSAVTNWDRIVLVQYNTPEYVEGKAYKLVLPIYQFSNTFANGCSAIRYAAFLTDSVYDVPEATEADKVIFEASDGRIASTSGAIYSDWAYETSAEVEFDITEAVKAAFNANRSTLTFKILAPWGGVQFVNREIAGLGGEKEGLASYIKDVAANTVSVTGAQKLTKSGSNVALTNGAVDVAVPNGSSLKVTWADTTIAYVDENGTVTRVNAGDTATVTDLAADAITTDKTLAGDGMFVSLVPGAQVRYGQGVDSTTGKIKEATGIDDATAGSGLRFIATVTTTSPLAGKTGVVPGVRIEAADNTVKSVDIDADKYQTTDGSVFTVALTNLLESNYNRVFTATPYVTINGEKVMGTQTVSRSIYEVAAGILVQKTYEGTTEHEPAMGAVITDVLNAYVNQVGVRLKLASNGTAKAATTGDGSYAGGRTDENGNLIAPDVFFDVTSYALDNSDSANPKYTIELTANGTDTKFASFCADYIRINNYAAQVRNNSDLTVSPDGKTLTIEFYPNGKPTV